MRSPSSCGWLTAARQPSRIAIGHGGMDDDEATAYVRRLSADKRYVRDGY